MLGRNSALALIAVLVAACASAAPPYSEAGEPPSRAAFNTADEALSAAVEVVCRPYLAGQPNQARAKSLAEAAGFRAASFNEALEGIGEDYVARIAPPDRSRVTIDFDFDLVGGDDCGVAVMGAAPVFDRYIDTLLTSGWKPAGAPIWSGAERVDWMWAPDGAATLVATRQIDMTNVSPIRVLALYLMKGQQPIPPKCGPNQAPPCRIY